MFKIFTFADKRIPPYVVAEESAELLKEVLYQNTKQHPISIKSSDYCILNPQGFSQENMSDIYMVDVVTRNTANDENYVFSFWPNTFSKVYESFNKMKPFYEGRLEAIMMRTYVLVLPSGLSSAVCSLLQENYAKIAQASFEAEWDLKNKAINKELIMPLNKIPEG